MSAMCAQLFRHYRNEAWRENVTAQSCAAVRSCGLHTGGTDILGSHGDSCSHAQIPTVRPHALVARIHHRGKPEFVRTAPLDKSGNLRSMPP